MTVYLLLAVLLLEGAMCALIGHVKHRDVPSFFFLGVLFGPFGIGYAALARTVNDENAPPAGADGAKVGQWL